MAPAHSSYCRLRELVAAACDKRGAPAPILSLGAGSTLGSGAAVMWGASRSNSQSDACIGITLLSSASMPS